MDLMQSLHSVPTMLTSGVATVLGSYVPPMALGNILDVLSVIVTEDTA